MNCREKHTRWQPTDKEFCCPACKAQAGDFFIDESASDEDENGDLICEKLHVNDYMYCNSCGLVISGADLAKRCARSSVSDEIFDAKLREIVDEKGWDVPGVIEILREFYNTSVLDALKKKKKKKKN